MGFETEKELFNTVINCRYFQKIFNSSYNIAYFAELKGLFGIPDLVIVNKDKGRTLAFELKLSNWKRALVQAYRYRSFAEKSLVILDKKYINPALSNIEKFKRANIGLLSIDQYAKIEFHFKPKLDVPYSDHLVSVFKKKMENQFH